MLYSPEQRLFTLAMRWRIGYGVFRIVFGLALLKVVGKPILDVVGILMQHELTNDPRDLLYQWVSLLLEHHPLYVTYFLATYFIFWGVVDIVLSYNLLKHRLWAFPLSIVLISAFIAYELIRFTHTHSFILLFILVLDAVIVWLISREYKKLRLRLSLLH